MKLIPSSDKKKKNQKLTPSFCRSSHLNPFTASADLEGASIFVKGRKKKEHNSEAKSRHEDVVSKAEEIRQSLSFFFSFRFFFLWTCQFGSSWL